MAFLFLNKSKVVLYFHISLSSSFSCYCFLLCSSLHSPGSGRSGELSLQLNCPFCAMCQLQACSKKSFFQLQEAYLNQNKHRLLQLYNIANEKNSIFFLILLTVLTRNGRACYIGFLKIWL